MATIQSIADKMGIPKAEAFEIINSWEPNSKRRIAELLRLGYGSRSVALEKLEQFAREFQLSETRLLDVLRTAGVPVNIVARSLVDLNVLLAAKRHIVNGADLAEVTAEVLSSEQTRSVVHAGSEDQEQRSVELTHEGEVPTIRLPRDIATMLTLSPIDTAIPPAEAYRVRIVPAYCGLESIDVSASGIRGVWVNGPPAGADLSQPLCNIALGACELLTKSSIPRESKEPDPIGKTQARMHDVVLVRIRTAVSDAIRATAIDVMEGRRGYSQVLAESIPVRAHLAHYRVGPGRTQSVLVLRAAHRRGGPGTRQRTYVLKT